jgi:hypothetical protein
MNATTTILSWALAGAPASTTDSAPPRATVEVERTDDTVQITERDLHGEVSAELFMWTDRDGRLRFDATWPDGLYLSVINDGEDATIDTADRAEVATRLELLDAAIQSASTGKGWVGCVFGVAATAAACAAVHPFWCVGGGLVAACECLPLVVKEFEDIECPGF